MNHMEDWSWICKSNIAFIKDGSAMLDLQVRMLVASSRIPSWQIQNMSSSKYHPVGTHTMIYCHPQYHYTAPNTPMYQILITNDWHCKLLCKKIQQKLVSDQRLWQDQPAVNQRLFCICRHAFM